jgi:hypothetical protein
MPKDWIALPYFASEKDVPACPEGWTLMRIDNLFDDVPSGKRYDKKTVFLMGEIPVLDQSAEGYLGFHDDAPGVECSPESPVVSFANHTCEMRLNTRPYSCIQNIFSMTGRPDIATTEFLYYGTKGRVRLEEYKGHHPMFREGWIVVPPIPEQRAITSILSVFDDKIELNRRTAETLEAMARAVFKSWFVDFDPVHAKAAGRLPEWMDAETAALFPDRFGEDGLPEGWEERPLSHLLQLSIGGVWGEDIPTERASSQVACLRGIDVADIADGGLASKTPRRFIAPKQLEGRRVEAGDIIIEGSGSNCGRSVLWTSNHDQIYEVPTVYSNFCKRLTPLVLDDDLQYLIWMSLRAQFAAGTIANFRTGTSVPNLDIHSLLDQIKVVVPNDPRVVGRYRELTSKWASVNWALENRSLAAIRDALLPRLLSGELRVDDAEKFAEGVL